MSARLRDRERRLHTQHNMHVCEHTHARARAQTRRAKTMELYGTGGNVLQIQSLAQQIPLLLCILLIQALVRDHMLLPGVPMVITYGTHLIKALLSSVHMPYMCNEGSVLNGSAQGVPLSLVTPGVAMAVGGGIGAAGAWKGPEYQGGH